MVFKQGLVKERAALRREVSGKVGTAAGRQQDYRDSMMVLALCLAKGWGSPG